MSLLIDKSVFDDYFNLSYKFEYEFLLSKSDVTKEDWGTNGINN